MSFLNTFKAAMASPESFESGAENSEDITQQSAIPSEEYTPSEIAEVRIKYETEHEGIEDTVSDAPSVPEIHAVNDRLRTLEDTAVMVAQASPVEAQGAVDMANTIIEDSAVSFSSGIPKFDTDEEGKVDETSMESVVSWISNAGKGFADAIKSAFTRLGASLKRLLDSSEGIASRASVVVATIKKRNGEGGKGIKFASKYLQRLVKGSEYSKNLPEDLEKTAKVYKEHIDILIDYGNAIYEYSKNAIVKRTGGHVAEIDTKEFKNKLKAISSSKPAILGNRHLAEVKPKQAPLGYLWEDGVPAASSIVRHADDIHSLTNDEIKRVATTVGKIATEWSRDIEQAIKELNESVQDIHDLVLNINTVHGQPAPAYDMVQLERHVLSEFISVASEANKVYGDLQLTLSAAIVLCEESIIQD